MQEITLILVAVILLELTSLIAINRNMFSRLSTSKPIFIDTSVLMDGRIIFAAQAGFIPPRIVVPRSVIAELQLLADGSDHEKRSRARHGLDVVKLLQDISGLNVKILKDGPARTGVDDQLLALAKKYHGAICTIDFNLNKVAVVENIEVLNINELAKQLRLAHLPGEHLSVELIQKGSDSHQAVGYLTDGTMVVVEQANRDIGKTIEIELIRSLQTAAGRMVFAKKISTTSQAVKSNVKGPTKKLPSKSKRPNHSSPTSPEDKLMNLLDQQK